MTDLTTIQPTEILPAEKKELTEADLPPLNTRQLAMLNYIMAGYNNSQAYIKAGYDSINNAHKGAHQLTSSQPLKAHIDFYRQQLSKSITKEWKEEKLKQIVDMSIDPHNPLANPDVAIRAMAELNKMKGDYAPQAPIQVHNLHASLDDIRQAKLDYIKEY